MDHTAIFYSSPSYIRGGGLPIYSGSRRQRGGSIFGALKRFFMPVITAFGKKVARQGAKQAVGLAKDVVSDAFMFRNVPDSVIKHGKKRALNLTRYAADEGLNSLENMIGSGPPAKRRRRRKQSLGKRKTITKKRKQRKSQRKPQRKRRRTAKALF